MTARRIVLWAACAALAFPGYAQAQEPTPAAVPSPPPFTRATAAAIDRLAREEIRTNTTPGVAVGVVRDGLLVYARGFGYGDLATHRHISASTQFYAGGLQAPMTAAAVLMLAQRHKLRLSDPVTKYVPEMTFANNVTIKQLLTGTSGVAQLAGSTHQNLAALIVQRVSGVPLSVFFQTEIFQPLIMTSTFLAGDQGIDPHHAAGYTRVNGRFVRAEPVNAAWIVGSAGLVTTIDDLAKWDIGLPLLLDVDSMREMLTPATTALGPAAQGMGWVIDQRGGRLFAWRNGQIPGYHAMNAVLPEQHIAVIVLANADSLHDPAIEPERLASRILDLVAPLPPAHFGAAITQRAAEWLARLESFQIDRTQLTPAFSQYLTDRVIEEAGLRGLGSVLSLVPVESFSRSGDTVYVFDVRFRNGAYRYQFALSPDGKIDGLLLQP